MKLIKITIRTITDDEDEQNDISHSRKIKNTRNLVIMMTLMTIK